LVVTRRDGYPDFFLDEGLLPVVVQQSDLCRFEPDLLPSPDPLQGFTRASLKVVIEVEVETSSLEWVNHTMACPSIDEKLD
jgi:hypothetical protein